VVFQRFPGIKQLGEERLFCNAGVMLKEIIPSEVVDTTLEMN